MPPFLIHGSAVRNGIWWLASKRMADMLERVVEQGDREVMTGFFASLHLHERRWVREILEERQPRFQCTVSCLPAHSGESSRAANLTVLKCSMYLTDNILSLDGSFAFICALSAPLFLYACICTTCGTQSQTVTYRNACGLLSAASLIQRPRRRKSRLPWRQLPATALPLMCHCHHLYVHQCVRSKSFYFHLCNSLTWTWIEHSATVKLLFINFHIRSRF